MRGRSTLALGMRYSPCAIAVLVAVFSAGSSPSISQATPIRVSICKLPSTGSEVVGRVVAVRGQVNQDQHWAGMVDKRCPGAIIYFAFERDVPSVIDCLTMPVAKCGALRRWGQTVTVVGLLTKIEFRPWPSRTERGVNPLGYLTVQGYIGN